MTEVESIPFTRPQSQLMIADASSLPLKGPISVTRALPSASTPSSTPSTEAKKPISSSLASKRSSFNLNRLSIISNEYNSPFSIFQKKIFSSSNSNLSQTSRSTSPESTSLSSSPPSPSSSLATSPNATTISSHDGSSTISRSLNLASPENISLFGYDDEIITKKTSRYSTIRGKSIDKSQYPIKDDYIKDFKLLESELPKFQSKSGVHRSNILRLALLPFLRQHRGEEFFINSPNSQEITYYRVKILQKWWSAILNAFKDRSISGSDRSLYLEGLSGLLSRYEFRSNKIIYQRLLYETIQLVISKLSLKTVPISVAAFSGKVLAYGFFFAPSIAPVLLHLLAVPQNDIDRVIACSFSSEPEPMQYFHHQQRSFNTCNSLSDACLVLNSTCTFPKHLEPLIGYSLGRKSPSAISTKSMLYSQSRFYKSPTTTPPPPPPQAIPNIYGPWSRRWASSNSDVFIAFIKHYYSIMSSIITPELPWNAHLSSPGLLILHAFLLGSLDFVVHPNDGKPSPVQGFDDDLNTVAVSPVPANRTRRRVDQLKVLMVIREILHNDDICTQFYEPYCRQYERLLHAVAVKTSVYDVESCIILADLVEEYLSSLILSHSSTKQTVEIQKDKVIDWQFWIHVIQRMLSSDNSHTELRALAFLFNIWDNIPIGCNPRLLSDPLTPPRHNKNLEFIADENEGLRWNVIVWLLSPSMWERYFCHWQPLVRAYYHRLLCWRVASVGPESDLLSSILYSNCNADARILLAQRLETSYEKVLDAIDFSKDSKAMFPSVEPAPPVVNRQLSIFVNPAVSNRGPFKVPSESNISDNSLNVLIPRVASESSLSSQHLHRVNPFDVFDDVAYSYPPMASPKDNFFMLGRQSDRNEEIEDLPKKRWSILKPQGLKKYFTSTNSKVNLPVLDSEISNDLRTVKSKSPLSPTTSLTMSLIPPPPQLLRERPEINRPPYKFSLEYSEKIARKQVDLIMKRNRHYPVENNELKTPVKPRLPFEYDERVETLFVYRPAPVDNENEEDDIYKTCVSEIEFDSEITIEDKSIDVDDITDAYGSSNTEGDISEELTGAEIVESLLSEEKMKRILIANQENMSNDSNISILLPISDDSKYWRYAGRSLSEWSQAVQQFEEFVRSRRMMGGVTRLEDLGVPFLVAEIPAKVLAG